jgi:hypothetical protein
LVCDCIPFGGAFLFGAMADGEVVVITCGGVAMRQGLWAA